MKESQNIEWKQNWRDEYLRRGCGFANAQGGSLMTGQVTRQVEEKEEAKHYCKSYSRCVRLVDLSQYRDR